jgi:hypothetical protein
VSNRIGTYEKQKTFDFFDRSEAAEKGKKGHHGSGGHQNVDGAHKEVGAEQFIDKRLVC